MLADRAGGDSVGKPSMGTLTGIGGVVHGRHTGTALPVAPRAVTRRVRSGEVGLGRPHPVVLLTVRVGSATTRPGTPRPSATRGHRACSTGINKRCVRRYAADRPRRRGGAAGRARPGAGRGAGT